MGSEMCIRDRFNVMLLFLDESKCPQEPTGQGVTGEQHGTNRGKLDLTTPTVTSFNSHGNNLQTTGTHSNNNGNDIIKYIF